MNFRNLNTRLPKRALLLTAAALLLLSFLSSWYFKENPSTGIEQTKLEKYLHREEKNVKELFRDTMLMLKLSARKESLDEFQAVADRNYGVFIYTAAGGAEPKLMFWNSQRSLPPADLAAAPDGEYFSQLPNGYYVTIKKTIRASQDLVLISYAMIPVMYKFDYQHSGYLETMFVHDRQAIDKIEISVTQTGYVIRSGASAPLFYIKAKPYNKDSGMDTLTAVLRILALILLLGYIHFAAESFSKRRSALAGIGLLFVLLLFVRVILNVFPALFSLRQLELFNSTIYGNFYTWLNRSLGDLLINAIFVCWFVVYAWSHIGSFKKLPAFFQDRTKGLIAGTAGVFFLILCTFEFANVVRSLVRDSKISFNVIDFFSLDIYTVVGFIVLAVLSLAYYYLTRIIFRFIFPAFGNPAYVYFVLAFTGLIFLSFRSGNNIVLFHLPVLLWLLGYTALVNQEKFIVNRFRITIAGVLFWIFIFSLSLAGIIMAENKEKELKFRKAMAEKYDQLTDPSGELTLSIALAYLDNEFLKKNFDRFLDPVENNALRDSIVSENITGYLNKYHTKIFVFDSLNQPVNNLDPGTYSELNNLFSVQSKPTGITDLYYHETAYDQFTYITKRVIRDSTVKGSFFIVSTPKKYNTDALYPELFRRISETDAENSPVYSYAIYNKNLLISSSSKYSFPINLQPNELPVTEFERRINGEYDELWYKPNTRKIVIVARKSNSAIESITLFSYLFCAFLLLVALMQFISILLKIGSERKSLRSLFQVNIRTQVHSTVIFISILSFLVIGVATISFFITRYERNNIDKLSRTAAIMVKEMQKRIAANNTFDDVIRIYDSVTNENLQTLIDEVAEIHNVDVNVYDVEGNLQVSSEPEVYKRGLLSTKIHPEAFYHLSVLRKVQYVQDESLSSLNYLSIYAAVRDEKGQVYAYLNIPYFLSQIDVNQEISNFLVTIINLNAFIFLIAGIVALIITNRITRSFSLIGDKMKEIRLGRENEEISWPRNDEIGELVKQYNKMVRQLEQSATALAKSEREGAWREMARQVAHEIKNPLTPMKLSIQYLQKAVSNNLPNVKELTTTVANTLVEQIDHLSKISSDFARFANIANTNAEIFDLHQVLEGLKGLHASNPRVEFEWLKLDQPVIIRADRTHMNRLFTNLITNSIEACTVKEKCHLTLSETLNGDYVRIVLRDNGEGIPEEMQEKIFTPNFTTKSSGTGLGLAMSKSIVEQAGGSIWFETKQGIGTSFYVELPLVNSE